MPTITMCVHGNAFCSQQDVARPFADFDGTYFWPNDVVVSDQGTPWGWGRTFFQGGWYHVALPIIVDFEGLPTYVDEVTILLDRQSMDFNELHLWEGGVFFWTGAPADQAARRLSFRPRDSSGQRLSMSAGLGISMHFTKTNDHGFLTFNSASVSVRTTLP